MWPRSGNMRPIFCCALKWRTRWCVQRQSTIYWRFARRSVITGQNSHKLFSEWLYWRVTTTKPTESTMSIMIWIRCRLSPLEMVPSRTSSTTKPNIISTSVMRVNLFWFREPQSVTLEPDKRKQSPWFQSYAEQRAWPIECETIIGKLFLLVLFCAHKFDCVFIVHCRLMAAVAVYTRLAPKLRIDKLNAFNRRLQNTPESMSNLQEWNFSLDTALVQVNGRKLPNEKICFGNNKT